MRKWPAALALLAGALGVFGFLRAGAGLSERSLVVDGVPLYETWDPSYTGQRSGIVVAHGFSGSAQLMKPWAETFARQGFMVVSLDFSGHGRNTHFLSWAMRLEDEVDIAVRHLNSLGVVPVALLGPARLRAIPPQGQVAPNRCHHDGIVVAGTVAAGTSQIGHRSGTG